MLIGRSEWGESTRQEDIQTQLKSQEKLSGAYRNFFFQHNNEKLIDWSKYRRKDNLFREKKFKKNNKKDHRALIQVQGQILRLVVGSPR